MAEYSTLKITNLGFDLQTKVQAGSTLTFTRFGLGNGVFYFPNDVPAMTALVNEKMQKLVSSVVPVNSSSYKISTVITVDHLPAVGFDMSEVGIFATDPDLGEILYGVVYAGANADHIPAKDAGPLAYNYAFNLVIAISDTANVTVVVDNSMAGEFAAHAIKLVDPTKTGTEKAHVTNDQAKTWEDHLSKSATDTEKGHIEKATVAEALVGTDDARAVTPAGLMGVAGAMRFGGQLLSGGNTTVAPPEVVNNNFNVYKTGGVWYIANGSTNNGPTTSQNRGVLEILHGANGYHQQRLFSMNTGATWTRYTLNSGSTWTDWKSFGASDIALKSSFPAVSGGGYWNITGLTPFIPAYVTSLCSVTNTMSVQSGCLYSASWRTGYVESTPVVAIVPNLSTVQIYYSLVNGSGILAIYQ